VDPSLPLHPARHSKPLQAEPNDPLLAAADRHGHRPSLRLQMPKRFPAAGRIPQAGPERGRRDAVVTDRQRPDPLRRWDVREKIFNLLPRRPRRERSSA